MDNTISPTLSAAFLEQNRQLERMQAMVPTGFVPPPSSTQADFGAMVRAALGEVNQMQVQSAEWRNAYERGADLPLTDVVLSMQKSSLAFEATLQIRNKVLKAYDDIMSMPV